jgi:nicotinamidase-related amidase
MLRMRRLWPLAAVAVVLACVAPASAQTIIDEWQSIQAPPAPMLKAVTVAPKTTALLVMDIIKQFCNDQNRPRCVASIPKIATLLAAARASGVTIIYTVVPSVGPNAPAPVAADIIPAIAPKADEPVMTAAIDKFIVGNKDTGLEKILKDKGITSVIMVGTAAHGAVLFTASAAASRGFNVIVPVDGMSAPGQNTNIEQAVAYILTTAPVVAPKVTLTRIDMIKFQ